jgi:uncharacterized protein
MQLEEKRAALDSTLLNLGSVLVAYSGGTDSGFLAWAAHRVLGDRMLAVIADSASLPRAELSSALEFARICNFRVHILHTAELSRPEYQRNDANRCFHCKDELFHAMEQTRQQLGFDALAYGMNADDRGAFRPGQRAAALHHAHAPLAEAELTKDEIRAIARAEGLTLWDKPASACLSSRIEYGRPVTEQALAQVEAAEAALHALGFRQVRVRHHGDLARIEIEATELSQALDLAVLAKLSSAIKSAGFLYSTLDTEGYRSGSMNAVLPVAALISKSR